MSQTNKEYKKERIRFLKRENAILAASKESNLKRTEIAALLEDLEASAGVTYKEFLKYKLWQYSPEEVASIIDSLRMDAEPAQSRVGYYISMVMQETGWSRKKTRKTILEAKERIGCTFKEYYAYRMFNMSEEMQNQLYLTSHGRIMSSKYDVSRLFLRIILNKRIANIFFGKYMKRNWALNTRLSQSRFIRLFPPGNSIIYKPLKGQGGMGIEVFDLTEENASQIFEELKQYPEGVIETFIRQHEDMKKLCPTSVNTIRLVTVCASGKKEILQAVVRMSNGTASVDNFCSGGIAASIDMKTGRITSRGVDENGHVYPVHPYSNISFIDYQIPLWDQVLDMVTKAMHEPLVKGYLGWDVAITDNGPVLVEVNTSPSIDLISLPAAVEGKGLLEMMKPYFE